MLTLNHNCLVVLVTLTAVPLGLTMSNPQLTQVAGPERDQEKAQDSRSFDGFMEDIGFQNFFQDVGLETAASSPGLTKIMPAASSNFPSFGNVGFSFGSPSELTKEQLAAQKEVGFMPANPFGSASNPSSNIVPPEGFNSGSSIFGDFQFPKAFHSDFGNFNSGSFGSGPTSAPSPKSERKTPQESSPRVAAVEHRPRNQAASRNHPQYAQRRQDDDSEAVFYQPKLFASSSQTNEKKDKGVCKISHKDGMTCEVCNDNAGGFSEHCSHSQNSGKDRKFTTNSRHTTDDLPKPKQNPTAQSQASGVKTAPHQGIPHHGAPHHGAPHQGIPHHGAPHHGAPHQGAPQQGAPHHGASHDGGRHPAQRHPVHPTYDFGAPRTHSGPTHAPVTVNHRPVQPVHQVQPVQYQNQQHHAHPNYQQGHPIVNQHTHPGHVQQGHIQPNQVHHAVQQQNYNQHPKQPVVQNHPQPNYHQTTQQRGVAQHHNQQSVAPVQQVVVHPQPVGQHSQQPVSHQHNSRQPQHTSHVQQVPVNSNQHSTYYSYQQPQIQHVQKNPSLNHGTRARSHAVQSNVPRHHAQQRPVQQQQQQQQTIPIPPQRPVHIPVVQHAPVSHQLNLHHQPQQPHVHPPAVVSDKLPPHFDKLVTAHNDKSVVPHPPPSSHGDASQQKLTKPAAKTTEQSHSLPSTDPQNNEVEINYEPKKIVQKKFDDQKNIHSAKNVDEFDKSSDESSKGSDSDKGIAHNHSVDFDFEPNFGSFGSSPFAQSRQDKVYNRPENSNPFHGFEDPFDHFAEESNADPYKFEIPTFENIDFDFGPDNHEKIAEDSGIRKQPKQSTTKETRVAAFEPQVRSGSQQNNVAQKNLAYQPPKPKENYDQLGKMINQFGKKNRQNCKKEIRKGMTCYVCPNKFGQSDEECMYTSNDPHSQHMMYTEESSYGNPK